MPSERKRVVVRLTPEEEVRLDRLKERMREATGVLDIGWGDVMRAGMNLLARHYLGEDSVPVPVAEPRAETPPPRPRGRPRKEKTSPVQPKRPRGRPRKE